MVSKRRRSRKNRRAIKETLKIDQEFRDKTGMGVLEVLKEKKCKVLQEFIQLMANLKTLK